jgi:dienelactone hydrolase
LQKVSEIKSFLRCFPAIAKINLKVFLISSKKMSANSKLLSVISATILSFSAAGEVFAVTPNPNPLFKDFERYELTNGVNNDPTDIYFPNPSDLDTGNYSFPVVLLLQGALVDKLFYSNYAGLVARYGFIVVVPNHKRSVNTPQGTLTGLLPETSQINVVLSQMANENLNPSSPIEGIVDTQKLGLLGHSLGGAVGLSAIANRCLVFLCEGSFARPEELKAGAFFGANLRDQVTEEFIPINNSGIAVALLQGDRDSRALPLRAEATYNNIQTAPKSLITVLGANHFGIANVNKPSGAIPDPSNPSLPQGVAIETVARWSALFLRANMLGDRDAFNYVFNTGDAIDANVIVARQSKPVPEPSAWIAIVGLGVFIAVASYQLPKPRA